MKNIGLLTHIHKSFNNTDENKNIDVENLIKLGFYKIY